MNKYGLLFDNPDPSHYVFGASSVPMDILQPDGNWSDYLPVKERQNPNNFETYACVIFTLLNCIEILIKKQYGEERNYSERFLATLVNTRGAGTTPQLACEFLRKMGVPPQDIWPFDVLITDEDKFFSKIPDNVLRIANDFNKEFDFRHEFVEIKNISEALKYSPLMISVCAWFTQDGKTYYMPQGYTDNHATTCIAKEGAILKIFDSYDPFLKDYSGIPMVAKRFWVKKKELGSQNTLADSIVLFLRRLLFI